MRAIVVYYSLEGDTKYVAEKIAQRIGADLLNLEPVKPYPTGKASKYLFGGKAVVFGEHPKLKEYHFTPEDYDLVILGTPVWAGGFTPPLRTFLAEQDLSQKEMGLFVCSAGGNGQKCLQKLMETLEISKAKAQLSLVDPAKKPSLEKDKMIEAFADSLVC